MPEGPVLKTKDSEFAGRVRASFARQGLMATLGARMTRVEPGETEIELPFRADLTQQNGYLHAAAVTAIVDSACGYAAMTLTAADEEILTVEFKVNFLSPAIGEMMIARGTVTKPGRNLIVCAGEVQALSEGRRRTVAVMMATTMVMRRN